MIGYSTYIIINIFFECFKRYQKGSETSLKSSDLVFIGIEETRHKFHKIALNFGSLHIDTLEQINIKRTAINAKTKGNKFFQLDILPGLNYKYTLNY